MNNTKQHNGVSEQNTSTRGVSNHWVTSDLHFFHQNIMKFSPATRPYTSVEQMHEAIIADWNSKVKKGDIIYHLGDMFFCKTVEEAADIIERLNGSIVWLRGNHDYSNIFNELPKLFPNKIRTEVYLEVKYDKQKIIMFHYPILEWNGCHRGSFHFHGHCHGNINHKNAQGRRIDVGWDSLGSIQKVSDVLQMLKDKPLTLHHE